MILNFVVLIFTLDVVVYFCLRFCFYLLEYTFGKMLFINYFKIFFGCPCQACIYLLRICTIPFGNLEMRLLFRTVSYFSDPSNQKDLGKWHYFHHLSQRLQLLHSCGHLCLQWVGKSLLKLMVIEPRLGNLVKIIFSHM